MSSISLAYFIVRNKKPLDEVILPESYLIIQDDHPLDNLAKAVNVLTVKKGYRIVSFSTVILWILSNGEEQERRVKNQKK